MRKRYIVNSSLVTTTKSEVPSLQSTLAEDIGLTPESAYLLPEEQDDQFGDVGITIGTSIGPDEQRLLSLGPALEPDQALEPDYEDARPHLLGSGPLRLAAILRGTRLSMGLSLEDVAEFTRVRRAYLEALEKATYDILPPKAFSIGYVRAYAKALHLDEQTLADMFKSNFEDPTTSLRAPTGTSFEETKPNYSLYISIAVGIVIIVVGWNVLQRTDALFNTGQKLAALGAQSWSEGQPLIRDGVVLVSKPAPAPKDQDLPEPYYTPGLEAGFSSIAAERRSDDQVTPNPGTLLISRRAFNPKGAIFGAQPESSLVTLQARRSVNIVMRTQSGIVYFARQLQAGEAYRMPQSAASGTLIDVSDFSAFDVFYDGELAGGLDALVVPVSQLNAKAQSAARLLDQQAQSQAKLRPPPVVVNRPQPLEPVVVVPPQSREPIPYLPSLRPQEPQNSSETTTSEAN
jgi:cytoskeleton protein RodZ